MNGPEESSRVPARRASVTAYPDGPLLVRGDVELVDGSGVPIPHARRTVALCRCGVSAIKPFCDGTHKLSGFHTDDDITGDAST